MTDSVVYSCIIEDVWKYISGRNNVYSNEDLTSFYHSVAVDVLKALSLNEIVNISNYNIESGNKNTDNYHWDAFLGLSVQRKDYLNALSEIIRLVKLKKWSMKIIIKLKNGHWAKCAIIMGSTIK